VNNENDLIYLLYFLEVLVMAAHRFEGERCHGMTMTGDNKGSQCRCIGYYKIKHTENSYLVCAHHYKRSNDGTFVPVSIYEEI